MLSDYCSHITAALVTVTKNAFGNMRPVCADGAVRIFLNRMMQERAWCGKLNRRKEVVLMKGILNEYIGYIDSRKINMFGICVQQNGKLMDEYRWTADTPHHIFSMSKSYTSIAVGMAIDEGLFSLNDKIVSFFPDLLPEEVSEYTASVTVRDLLMMACGVSRPVLMNGDLNLPYAMDEDEMNAAGRDWAKTFLAVQPDM